MCTRYTNVSVDITLLDMQTNMHENKHVMVSAYVNYSYTYVCKHMQAHVYNATTI